MSRLAPLSPSCDTGSGKACSTRLVFWPSMVSTSMACVLAVYGVYEHGLCSGRLRWSRFTSNCWITYTFGQNRFQFSWLGLRHWLFLVSNPILTEPLFRNSALDYPPISSAFFLLTLTSAPPRSVASLAYKYTSCPHCTPSQVALTSCPHCTHHKFSFVCDQRLCMCNSHELTTKQYLPLMLPQYSYRYCTIITELVAMLL